MDKAQLQKIFSSPYDQNKWVKVLREVLKVKTILEPPRLINLKENNKSISAFELGSFYTVDERLVGLYEIKLSKGVKIEKNRVALRELLHDIYKYDVDAALVVFVQEKKWRFSFISEIRTAEEDRKTDTKRFTYLFGEGETSKTAADRFDNLKGKDISLLDLFDAFNVDKLGKDFFKNYKETYEDFVQFITGKRFTKKGSKYIELVVHEPNWQFTALFNKDDKEVRDFCKRMMGRIVFLYFIQKKGWLAVGTGKKWGEGEPNYLYHKFKNSKNKDDFYFQELMPLFFRTLNDPDSENEARNLRFPYLNGGLFDDTQDRDFNKLQLPEETFTKLFETFNNYNFTIYEDAPDEQTVAVDPEMLGHIFENLLEDNKDKGAFYTPKEIVHYMCKESIKSFLFAINIIDENNTFQRSLLEKIIDQKYLEKEEYEFVQNNAFKILDALDHIKICDPAIGSGAFPMGLLQEIFNIQVYLQDIKGFKKNKSDADIKKHIIEENIYGVDIDPGAVDISRLRFWLSLVVDEVNPQPLPNLNFKIVCANTLIPLGELNHSDFDPRISELFKKLEKLRHDFFNVSSENKIKLERNFKEIQTELLELSSFATTENNLIYNKVIEFNPFEDESCSWFDPWWMFGVKDGFDIIIGNPPYIKESTNKSAFDGFRKTKYYQGKMDLWYGFACVMLDNLKKNTGIISFIATNNWVTNAGASKFRNKIAIDAEIIKLIDFTNFKIFESADIQTMIMFFKRNNENNEYSFDFRKIIDTQVTLNDVVEILEKKESNKFQYLDPIFNRNSLKEKTFVFSNDNDSEILNTILLNGHFYIDGKSELMSGIDVLQDSVNKNSQLILGDQFKVGDGIFVLSNEEKQRLNLSDKENELIKPYFTTKELGKMYGNKNNNFWIIYTDSSFKGSQKINQYPKIKEHLDQFKNVITSENGPYGLNRPRDQYFFQGEKILSVRKCAIPSFSYTDFDCYVSRAFFSIKSTRINQKYLAAILNSKLVAFWLKHKGKMQGFQYQIDKDPLVNIPIAITKDISPFTSLVDYIIFLKENPDVKANNFVSNEHIIQSFEDLINACVYELYFAEHMKEKEIDVLRFVKDLIKPIDNQEKAKEIVNSVYSKLKEPNNEIRNRMLLFATRSENILLPIQKIY